MASEKEKQSRSSKDKERASSKDREHGAKDQEKRSENRSRASESKSQDKSNKSSKSKEHESRLAPGKSARTTDHATIQRWVEERGGSPATVKATEGKNDPGLLRINFPGYSGADRLEDISWEDFFKKFDEKHLEFLYQDETRDGETSRFWKFVSGGEHEDEDK